MDYYYPYFIEENTEHQRFEMTLLKATVSSSSGWNKYLSIHFKIRAQGKKKKLVKHKVFSGLILSVSILQILERIVEGILKAATF